MNPYQPPAADALSPVFAEAESASRLATRGQRLGAALIDTLLGLILVVPMQFKLGMFRDFPKIHPGTASERVMWGIGSFLVWALVHGYFIFTSSQTIGKRLVGIRIDNLADGQPAEPWKIIALRYLPISLVSQIPVVGVWFAACDPLLIFRKDRRCLHDHIANTTVSRVAR